MPIFLSTHKDPSKSKKKYQGVQISSPQPVHLPKAVSKVHISLANLPKIPSRSPSLQDSSRLTQSFSPLRSHSSPEPSTNAQPQLPHRSAIPPALQIQKSLPTRHLDKSDGFEEVDLESATHYSSEPPPSFVKEVDDKINRKFDVESLYSPDAVEKEFRFYATGSPELKRNLTLGSDSGRFKPQRGTQAIIQGIQVGPYSDSETLTSEQDDEKRFSYTSRDEDGMIDHRAQKIRHIAFYVYAFVIGAMAVVGIVLAAVAFSQTKISPMTILLGNVPVAASLNLSLPLVTGPEMPHLDVSAPLSRSIHDQTTSSSHRSHSPNTRVTSTDVSYQLLDYLTAREEAIAFDAPTETPCITTTTLTSTTTITLASTIYPAPTKRAEPRDMAMASSRSGNGLYAAPASKAVPKRSNPDATATPPNSHGSPTATRYVTNNREVHILQHPTANAAAPRITAPWSFNSKRAPTRTAHARESIPFALPTPPAQISVLPTHFHLTPPPSWSTNLMLAFPSQALNSDYSSKYFSSNTVPASLSSATPPPYAGRHLSKTWADYYPFPIPTGYASPNIVPKAEQVGNLTFNTPGTGSCGFPDILGNEYAVAISWVLFDIGREIGGSSLEPTWQGMLPDGVSKDSSALCNRWINVWMGNGKGGKSVEHMFVVRDRCAACNVTHLDIQQDVFEKFWAEEKWAGYRLRGSGCRQARRGYLGRWCL